MINLIPNEEKKIMIKDFYLRLLVVSFVMLGISALIAVTAIVPSYFLSSVKKNVNVLKLETQKNEPMPLVDQKTLSVIDGLKSKLNLIEKINKKQYVVSQEIISKVISKKMSDIKINQIYYEVDAIKGRTINISGTAPSRERLLLFRQALEQGTNFKKVDLPISNFIKGSNIEFNLSITAS